MEIEACKLALHQSCCIFTDDFDIAFVFRLAFSMSCHDFVFGERYQRMIESKQTAFCMIKIFRGGRGGGWGAGSTVAVKDA